MRTESKTGLTQVRQISGVGAQTKRWAHQENRGGKTLLTEVNKIKLSTKTKHKLLNFSKMKTKMEKSGFHDLLNITVVPESLPGLNHMVHMTVLN